MKRLTQNPGHTTRYSEMPFLLFSLVRYLKKKTLLLLLPFLLGLLQAKSGNDNHASHSASEN